MSRASSGSGDSDSPRRNSRRPKYSKFTQQELPACKPIFTPQWVISAFTLVSIVFVPIGVALLLASNKVVEIVDRYDTACVPDNMANDKVAYVQNERIGKTCTRILTIPKDMGRPIYVYYQIDNFYQNHRRYVQSRSDAQLRDAGKANDTSNCAPEKKTSDGSSIIPCGLIAWSLFNDTYSFVRGNENLAVNKKGISWKSDREHKFGKDVYPKNFQNGTLIGGGKLDPNKPLENKDKNQRHQFNALLRKRLSKQEDLIVWMRTAALPTFRKLYGKIETDLKENDTITVTLENNYNTYSFSGKKKLVLSTTSWLGGKNGFLGLAYLSVGGLCFVLATAFTLVYLINPRKLGDPLRLSRNENLLDH